MTLVVKGEHAKWTGGFVDTRLCRCDHVIESHDEYGCHDFHERSLRPPFSRLVPCHCAAFKEIA